MNGSSRGGSGNIGSLAPVSTGFLTFSDFSHGVLIQDSPCECVAIVGNLELVPRAQLLGLVGVPEGLREALGFSLLFM